MRVIVQTLDFDCKPMGEPYMRDLSGLESPGQHLEVGAPWYDKTGQVEYQVFSVTKNDNGETVLQLKPVRIVL